MKRLLGFRKQIVCDPGVLEYPLSVLKSDPEYSLENIVTAMPSDPEDLKPPSFPDGVTEYIWVHQSRDQLTWYALCRMEDSTYTFFEAFSDSSGFQCKGTMRLYVSKSRPYLIQFALSEVAYQQYLRDTTYFKKLEAFEGLNGPSISASAPLSDPKES